MFDYTRYEDFFTNILGVGLTTSRGFGTFDNTFIKIFVSGGIIGFLIFLKTIIDAFKVFLIKIPGNVWRELGLIITFLWLIESVVEEFQEMFSPQ